MMIKYGTGTAYEFNMNYDVSMLQGAGSCTCRQPAAHHAKIFAERAHPCTPTVQPPLLHQVSPIYTV